MTVTAVLSAGTYLGLTTDGWIAVGTLLLVLVTALGVWSSLIAERRRTQPIVIAHAVGQARFAAQGDGVVLDVHLTNEGGGTAFNVRFGVEYAGVRFPWKHAASDPDSGSRQRIVKAGEREPAEGSTFAIPIPHARAMLGEPVDDDNRVYWSRYENAFGRVWETRNPWQRAEDLDIRRVRFVRLREWRERRQLRALTRKFNGGIEADFAVMRGTVEAARAEQEAAAPRAHEG
ncbi:MAG TPA: hypothetical protein VFA66_00070 [Gaiellaceae bacterium]|nr:hypothetical protein [Gaiellaceae bacterium]